MYRAFGLLQPKSDFTLSAATERLKARFPQLTVERNEDRITLSGSDWDYYLAFVTGDFVKTESEQFAERIAGIEDGADIVACDRRVEVWSDTPDPFMEHFDDHFQVLDVLRTFNGVILIDPNEPSLL